MRRILILGFVACSLLLGTASAEAEAGRAVVLMAAQSDAGIVVTFGRNAVESGPLARLVRTPLESAGATVLSAKDVALPTNSAPLDGLPLGDEAAVTIARSVGANIAVVVGLIASSEGAVRATSLTGQRAQVVVRVLNVTTGRAVFSSRNTSAAYGTSGDLARSVASTKALSRAVRGIGAKIMLHWPAVSQRQGLLSLQITGAEGWRAVASILRSLAATRGVSSVHALEIRPSRVVLSIASQQGAAQVVDSLRRARIHNGSLSVQLSGTSLAVRVVMNTPATPPPVNNG